MIYAERFGKEGEPYIAERGVFMSVEEYVPYRKKGWESTPDIDAKADEIIKIRNTPDAVLRYLAPMIRTGEVAREELDRRQQFKEQMTAQPESDTVN